MGERFMNGEGIMGEAELIFMSEAFPRGLGSFLEAVPAEYHLELNNEKVEYREWETALGSKCYGTVLKNSDLRHGIVREVDKFG